MKLKRFFGLTSRAVLVQVRNELGPDAVIIANRPTAEGVEVDALAGDAVDAMVAANRWSQMRADVAGLRALLDSELSQLARTHTRRRNPLRAQLTRELLCAG